jgi:diaminohydroxyphosphoribosylaminopyrimidine deaminase/5-amino-6-(5-phosphoribosylamino)uracil reductase
LEPCATPDLGAGDACADLLIEAKVAEVYMSVLDPDHKTNGMGKKRMEEAGIKTHLGLLADEAYAQNPWFYKSRGIELSK